MAQANQLIESHIAQPVSAEVEMQDRVSSVPITGIDTVFKSPILDVIDIKETTVKTVKPFELKTDKKNELPIEVLTDKELNIEQISSGVKTETKKDDKPKNAYEQAVADGFEGTVTEWIEWSIKEKKVNPYDEAV